MEQNEESQYGFWDFCIRYSLAQSTSVKDTEGGVSRCGMSVANEAMECESTEPNEHDNGSARVVA